MDPFQIKLHQFRTNKDPEIHISGTSRFPENRSLFVGKAFFQKLRASKNDIELYRRNILGPNFQKHPLFQFTGLCFLNLRSLCQDLSTKILRSGSKILVPGSWYQDLDTKKSGELERRSLSKIEQRGRARRSIQRQTSASKCFEDCLPSRCASSGIAPN